MQNRRIVRAAILAVWLGTAAGCAGGEAAPDFAKYIWEFPDAIEIHLPPGKQWLQDDLRLEVDKILAAGHLAPYYFNSADLHHEGYFLYVAPGRIVTTLAWAYPHLTAEQQVKVKAYVAAELANSKYAPWAGPKLPWNEGTGREGFDAPKAFNFDRWWGMEGQRRPFMHTLYGAWLYAQRSGDWETVKKYWPQLKQFYSANAQKAELYGEFGAPIAVARLARHFGDAEFEKIAVANVEKSFAAGLDYAAMEKASLNYFNRLKENRHNVLRSTHFMLLNLTPEVGRYLKDNVGVAVLQKNDAIKRSYPHWWFIAPPYATWAGNIGPDCEGVGLPREIFGMIFPVERWVADSNADALSTFMTSGPDGLGDCFWLEGLAQTIEAYGTIKWETAK